MKLTFLWTLGGINTYLIKNSVPNPSYSCIKLWAPSYITIPPGLAIKQVVSHPSMCLLHHTMAVTTLPSFIPPSVRLGWRYTMSKSRVRGTGITLSQYTTEKLLSFGPVSSNLRWWLALIWLQWGSHVYSYIYAILLLAGSREEEDSKEKSIHCRPDEQGQEPSEL